MRSPTQKFVVRLPPGMREVIAERAAYYRRSMNSEIVLRLEQSLNGIPDTTTEQDLEPELFPQMERLFRPQVTDQEWDLIRTFRRLSGERRRALLELLS